MGVWGFPSTQFRLTSIKQASISLYSYITLRYSNSYMHATLRFGSMNNIRPNRTDTPYR